MTILRGDSHYSIIVNVRQRILWTMDLRRSNRRANAMAHSLFAQRHISDRSLRIESVER